MEGEVCAALDWGGLGFADIEEFIYYCNRDVLCKTIEEDSKEYLEIIND